MDATDFDSHDVFRNFPVPFRGPPFRGPRLGPPNQIRVTENLSSPSDSQILFAMRINARLQVD
jgi:hypothetical protein